MFSVIVQYPTHLSLKPFLRKASKNVTLLSSRLLRILHTCFCQDPCCSASPSLFWWSVFRGAIFKFWSKESGIMRTRRLNHLQRWSFFLLNEARLACTEDEDWISRNFRPFRNIDLIFGGSTSRTYTTQLFDVLFHRLLSLISNPSLVSCSADWPLLCARKRTFRRNCSLL